MKLRIYIGSNGQTSVFFPNSVIEKYGYVNKEVRKMKIGNITFLGTFYITQTLNKDGSITKGGKVVLPKKMIEFFNWQNHQEIDLKITN